jgi:hypothetical protein
MLIRTLKQKVSCHKKIAARQGRIIVFIDKSVLSERPAARVPGPRRGETPVVQYSFSWKELSAKWACGAFTFDSSRLDQEPQVVQFLKALSATINKEAVRGRLQAHRSRLMEEYLESLNGRIALEYVPAYAAELNLVEYIREYLKHHAMPNFCARDLDDLQLRASRHRHSMQRRATLVTAF